MLNAVYPLGELATWPPLRIYTTDRGTHWLPVTDLVYLQGEINYTWLHCSPDGRVLIPHTLKRFEQQLPPSYFIRIHRRYVVNRLFVERVELQVTGASVRLKTGLWLPVSRRRYASMRQQVDLGR